jgi:hypothetical protein
MRKKITAADIDELNKRFNEMEVKQEEKARQWREYWMPIFEKKLANLKKGFDELNNNKKS